MLVLCVASAASAALTPKLTFTDGVCNWALDLANAKVTGTGTVTSGTYSTYIQPSTGSFTVTSGTGGGVNADKDGVYPAAGDQGNMGTNGPWFIPNAGDTQSGVMPNMAASMWFSFDVTFSGNDVVVDIYDSESVMHTAALQGTIPEPMTIALLGLGGLFLRRRR